MELLDAGISNVLDALKSAGSLDQQIDTPFGPMTRGVFLIDMTWDLLVHTWDLAQGTDQSTTLDSGLVEVIYHAFVPQIEGLRRMEFPVIKPMGQQGAVKRPLAGSSLRNLAVRDLTSSS